MRLPRIKAEGPAFYHCVSRVVEGRFIFQTTPGGSVEAEHFVGLMRRLEAFSGVRVLTYALMSNHFHLLCQVPQGEALSELELLERIEAGYGRQRRVALERQLARLGEPAQGASQSQQLLEPYRRRRTRACIQSSSDICRQLRSSRRGCKRRSRNRNFW